MNDMNTVPTHDFAALRWWDWLRPLGRCQHCYFPRSGHPLRNFRAIKRPPGDTSRHTWGEAAMMELDHAVQSADTGEEIHA